MVPSAHTSSNPPEDAHCTPLQANLHPFFDLGNPAPFFPTWLASRLLFRVKYPHCSGLPYGLSHCNCLNSHQQKNNTQPQLHRSFNATFPDSRTSAILLPSHCINPNIQPRALSNTSDPMTRLNHVAILNIRAACLVILAPAHNPHRSPLSPLLAQLVTLYF
ncbi:hypothetical protein PCASD_13990 [Puccinia coronata f. sp. avenae]|nr:hypothetical protein PCASD_13990 [Puccinia coronata f. sp. avenae]